MLNLDRHLEDLQPKLNWIRFYLSHRIQQPIPKLRILNFHKFLSNLMNNNKGWNIKCKNSSNWSKKSWKFGFLVLELVVRSGEQDICYEMNFQFQFPFMAHRTHTLYFLPICFPWKWLKYIHILQMTFPERITWSK